MRTSALYTQFNSDHRAAAISAMADVIAVCREGELGYAEAAKDVQDPGLKELFTQMAGQRRTFAEALERYSIWLGGAPDAPARLSGWIHRKWIALRVGLDPAGAASALAECERGEHAAVATYERALGIPMPEDLRLVLLEQVGEIRRSHDQLDRMRAR